MKQTAFEQKVKKQLWFLNKKEKKLLEDKLTMHHQKNDEYNYHKPVTFANAFLKQYIFKEKSTSSTSLFIMLIVMVIIYALLLGLFLAGFITSLTAVNYFVNPQVAMPVINVLLILIGAILLALVSLLLIKSVTALFTKKLLEYKFNKTS
ncbi:hypothetical protein MT340_005600 [Staphylococcus sp. NRL 16/872]|uniref:hypothetical protein n=1 Tax=Staphylococcus sp. NRL 16/872 TaxID=2930131 RepID=UPI001FB55435|nr:MULTISPECIES: hypothetical protein [unclassified Staphylococcus]MCJ1656078.1 hypothetical protein [Staphylococcus sp. NRL 21/187]MCJ1661863.1 hypothetical protein [Staphylococcus sp. NRL 18/288]MCJ1667892.1 hypothetical protein [Staphylococcus sp. NRL 19/737]WEN70382.1 hypothetical protein MT340_005600 [Staphylococcus sp. NRL 16/872]